MINYEKIVFDELGNVILRENPLTTCTKEELERRVIDREKQTGFWKQLLEDWIKKGIII